MTRSFCRSTFRTVIWLRLRSTLGLSDVADTPDGTVGGPYKVETAGGRDINGYRAELGDRDAHVTASLDGCVSIEQPFAIVACPRNSRQ